MPERRTEPVSDEYLNLIRAITELQVNSRIVAEAVKRLEDSQEGTVERKGMKERITLAEMNIEEHKKAWVKNEQQMKEMEGRISTTLQEAFLELTHKIDRQTQPLTSSLEEIKKKIESQQGFLSKYQPFVKIIEWAVVLVSGYLLMQIVSGQMVLIRP